MIITEPKWKRWVVETTGHIFTPKLCQDIIDLSKTLPSEKGKGLGKRGKEEDKEARVSTICWIPFDKMQYMYDAVNTFVQKTNKNHFGFGSGYTAVTNLVSNSGVVASDTAGVGTARGYISAAGYSTSA